MKFEATITLTPGQLRSIISDYIFKQGIRGVNAANDIIFNVGEVEMGDQRDPYKVLTLTGVTIKGIRLGEDER